MAPEKSNKRKLITLDTKLDIIKRFDNGESKANIGRSLGFGESTVRAVLNKATEYREQGKVSSASLSMQCTKNRSPLMIEMEDLLFLWLEDCNQKRIRIDSNNLRFKALSIFSALKETKYQDVTVTFSASKGWLENFKSRTGMKKRKLTGEAASADKDDTARYPAKLKKIIEENKYDNRQIFNVDELDLFWKKMQTRTFLPRKEATMPGCEELEELFRTIEKAKELILEIDPNVERSMNVCRGLDKQIDCYRKIMEEKKNVTSVQLTLDKFLCKK